MKAAEFPLEAAEFCFRYRSAHADVRLGALSTLLQVLNSAGQVAARMSWGTRSTHSTLRRPSSRVPGGRAGRRVRIDRLRIAQVLSSGWPMVMVIVKAVAVEGEGTCIGAAFKSVQLIATDFLACALSLPHGPRRLLAQRNMPCVASRCAGCRIHLQRPACIVLDAAQPIAQESHLIWRESHSH